MTVPQLIGLEYDSSLNTNGRVKIYRDGDVTTLGSRLPTLIGNAPPSEARNNSNDDYARVAWFKGALYVVIDSTTSTRGGILRSLDFGQNWTQVVDWATEGFSVNYLSHHLHNINIKGEPTLCWLGWHGTGDGTTAKSTDGVNWTFSANFDVGNTADRYGTDLVIGSKLWVLPSSATNAAFGGSQFLTVDFDSPSFADAVKNDGLNDAYCCSAWCYFNGAVYLARPDTRGASTTVNIYRLEERGLGATQDLVQTITHTSGNVNSNTTKWDMFTDGTNMYLFHWHSNVDAWLCHQIDSSFVVTDLSSTVLPTYMRSTTSGTIANLAGVVRVLTDQVTDPANPAYYIYVNIDVLSQGSAGVSTTAVPWRIYKWNGNASTMTFVDQGGSVMDAINFGATKTSRSEPFYTLSRSTIRSPKVDILYKEIQDNNKVVFRFQVRAGVTGLQTISVRGYYAKTGVDDLATSLATLESATQGTILSNVITGLSTGAAIYEVTWDAPTDGFADGDTFNFRFEARVA